MPTRCALSLSHLGLITLSSPHFLARWNPPVHMVGLKDFVDRTGHAIQPAWSLSNMRTLSNMRKSAMRDSAVESLLGRGTTRAENAQGTHTQDEPDVMAESADAMHAFLSASRYHSQHGWFGGVFWLQISSLATPRYEGTSLIRSCLLLGPYSRTMPQALRCRM